MLKPQSVLSVSYSSLTPIEDTETFETVIVQVIDDVLSGLGDVNKQAIYRYLKKHYDINENEIPYEIKDFARAIEQIFGPVAKLIEIKIIEQLHAKYKGLSCAPETGELHFVEFVHNLQQYLQLKT